MNLNDSKNPVLATLCLTLMLSISPRTYAVPGGEHSPLPAEMQQSKKITGTVSDAMGPIIGASVLVKGTGQETDLCLSGIKAGRLSVLQAGRK